MCWRMDGDVVLSYVFCVSTLTTILMQIYTKDYAISIATIHHLATAERRMAGVKVRSFEYHSYAFTNKQ